MLAVSPAITYATNATGDFECTFISESSRQIMGFSPEEALADKNFWVNHLHPQDAKHVLNDFSRLIAQGRGNLEYRFRHKEGYYRWFQDTFRVMRDDAGNPSEIVGSWADITHRKLADAVRELYSASLERQEPISLKKLDNILETGREVLQLDRLSILRADAERAVAAGGRHDRHGGAGRGDPRSDRAAGGGLAQRLPHEAADHLGWLRASAGETSPRSRPTTRSSRCARASSRSFRCVMQGQVGGVLVADRKMRRVPFDQATLESLRGLATQAALALEHTRLYAEAQPVLSRSLHLSVVYPAFARAVKALLPYDRIGVIVPEGRPARHGALRRRAAARVLGGTEVADDGGNGHRLGAQEQEGPRRARHGAGHGVHRFRVRGQGGRAREHHGSAARRRHGGRRLLPRQQDARRLHGAGRRAASIPWRSSSRSPSTTRRLLHEIESKSRQLEIANGHKSQFLANMSHELRTPLNAILGYTELIQDNIYGEVPEKIRRRSARRAERAPPARPHQRRARSLEDRGRAFELAQADYSMQEVVQAAVAAVEPLAAEKKLSLRVVVPPGLPRAARRRARDDAGAPQPLGNAVKFTEAGEVRPEVAASDGVFRISVADTGIGIAEADQQRIFEEFHQVEGVSHGRRAARASGSRSRSASSSCRAGASRWSPRSARARRSPSRCRSRVEKRTEAR